MTLETNTTPHRIVSDAGKLLRLGGDYYTEVAYVPDDVTDITAVDVVEVDEAEAVAAEEIEMDAYTALEELLGVIG